MAAVATTTSVANALKQLFHGKRVQDLAGRNRKFFKAVEKRSGFTGSTYEVVVHHQNGGGSSTTFATARANAAANKYGRFAVTRATKYGVLTVENELLLAAEGNPGAFVNYLESGVKAKIDEVSDALAIECYGDGNSYRGRRSSASTNVITLSNAADVYNFGIGMTVKAASAVGSGLRAGETTVTAVDPDAGTITLNSAAAIVSFADNDYLFADGDAPTQTTKNLKGMRAWIPTAAPSSGESFYGEDRSEDIRLYGARVTTTTIPIEEAIKTAATKVVRMGSQAQHCWMSPENYEILDNRMGDKRVLQNNDATFGFDSIVVKGATGDIHCISDPAAPADACFLTDMSTWFMPYLGPGVPFVAPPKGVGGGPHMEIDDEDAIEIRVRFYGALACDAPGKNAIILR